MKVQQIHRLYSQHLYSGLIIHLFYHFYILDLYFLVLFSLLVTF